METNGNQRKRVGRLNKTNNNNGSMGPPQPVAVEDHEVLEVAALAISPTSEGETTSSNTPAAECRRSSRKKIIKFDVRDLLNKNRKPHKIQIEARIDSNAPATSKTFAAPAGEISSKSSLSGLADLSSKQKTFLEKSAIFRRYSISQEPKAPPPPLPLPPSLLGKGNDNKDLNSSDTTTTRRLSRTQEFFSNVMIKPKQTTSLIVAQMESSAPSQIATRKSVNTAIEIETKLPQAIDTSLTSLQKRRGRPSKNKIQSTEDTSKEDESIKKITPEKAKNWKEYKACLAQQTSDKEKTIETTNKTIPKSSEALTADVVLEISSSSSSHNSNIEDSNEKEELEMKSLEQTQTQDKNQEDSVQNFNILTEIIIEDTNSKDSVIKTTQTQEVIEKAPTEGKDIEITEALGTDPINDNGKDKRNTQEQTKKDNVGVALEKDKNQLTEALEKEREKTDLSITEVKEKLDYTLKDSKQTLKDKEKLENVTEIPQSSLKDTSRTRRQTKLSATVAKETVAKGKTSPTNLDAKLQQEEADKNEATGKTDHAEKGNEIPKVFEKNNIKDSFPKEKESKENTAIDSSKQKDDSKKDQDAEVVAEKSVPPKKDVTTEKKPTKLDENLERDVKDDQSSKVMAITRRSRSKIDDTIAKETQPKASITPKETKIVKRNQTKLKDDMETPTNIQTLMSPTEKTKILQKDIDIITEPTVSQVLQTDSAKEEALNKSSTNEVSSQKDSIPAKTAKTNVQLKTAQKVPIKLDDVLATTTNSEESATESTRSRRSQYKRDDSIQNEKLIKTSDSEKIGPTKHEDSLLKDTASEAQHTQKEEAVSLTQNSGKTGQTKEDCLQIDTDSKAQKTQKEEQVSASQKSVKRGQSKVEDSLQKSTDSDAEKTEKEGKDSVTLKAGQTELVDSAQNDTDSDAQQTQEVEKVFVTQKAGKRGQTKKEDSSQTDKDLEALQTQKDKKDSVAQKSGKRCQRKVEDSIQKASHLEDQPSQKEEKDTATQKAGKRGQTKLEDSLQTESITQKEEKDSVEQKVGKKGQIKQDSSQTDKELEAPQIQNEEKDNIGEKAVNKSQKDKDSEGSQSSKEQEINKEKLEDDSLENQNQTKAFKQQTTGKRGQTKQKDSLATDIEPDASESQKEKKNCAAQKSGTRGQTKIEDSLQTDKLPEALQTKKEEKHSEAQKAGKRCSPKLKDSLQTDKDPEEKESVKQKAERIGLTKREDSLQKDEDSKATQSKPEQELVTKSLQSTKEKLDDLLQNESQTKTSQTIGQQKTRRRGQTKLEDSLQTNTVLENLQTQQDEKDSVTPQSTKDEEKAENISKDADNKDSPTDKDETDSKISQTSKIEESVTTTPKDYSIDLEVFSKLDSSLQNENLSKANTEQNRKKKGQAKLEDSSSEDKKSETSQTDKKALDSKTLQSPKEEAGTTRKSTRKEAAAQKESKEDCLKTDTVNEVIQSTKDEKRSRKAPAKLDDFVQNENITQTRKKGQIQITDAPKKVTESKILPTDKQELDTKTSLTSSEDNDNKRKVTKKESSTQKDININKLLIDKDAEVTLSPKEDTKTRRSRSKLEDPIQTQTSSTISKSAEEEIGNKDKCTKNESSTQKEDKAANFTDKEDLQTDNNKKQPIKNKRNLKKLDQVIQKEEQEEDSQLAEFTEKTTLSSSRRLELKTPEPTASTIQIEQENTPTLKISTKDSTSSQESSLSQPSTPSEEKSLTFSRTSSSSESENFSERSSFSSATSSSTSSSGRSYKSGDKLRVSIKRFSLPKSPSTSSQTSTSEEQNSPNTTLNINKKKPPIAKRSKRLQKKSLDNQDATENIDDCFQKILTDEQEATGTKNTNFKTIESFQEKQSVDEEKISSLKSTEKNKDVKTLVAQSPQTRNKKCNLIQESNEQIKVKESIEKQQQIEAVAKVESTKISSKSQDMEAMIDLDKPTTSKGQSSTDVLTAVKRKSLRIRKDDSEEKDQENKEIMLKSTEENKTDAEKIKEIEVKDKEKLVETKQQPKKKIEEHEESLTETKQTEKSQLQGQLDQEVEHEKKKESEKEEANQKKANRKEQEEKITEEKLQFKEIIEEKGKNLEETQEKDNVEQELMSATTNKPIRGKRSPRSLTSASDKEQSPKSTTKLSELKTDASPKIIKSKKETTSTEILLDEDKDQTSFTSATSKTGKLSPVELKVSEKSKITSTRSKTGKTIPNQAIESPKTLNKSSEKPSTPIEEANEKGSSDSYASEQLINLSLSIKSATDITEAESTKVTRSRTGKASPVEAADLSKNADATEKESLKPNTKKSKQKISLVESSKMSSKDTVQETEVDDIEKESTKGPRQIIKKDILPVEEKSLQNESMKTSSKKAKFETEANVNKNEISTITTTEEIAAIEIQKTSLLPLDINEQESSKKSKTEKDSSLLQLITTKETTKCEKETTGMQSPKFTSSTKSTPDMEQPSSAKRKSLRNQKDKNIDDTTVTAEGQDKLDQISNEIREETIISLNPTQKDVEKEKLDITPQETTEETIKIPKRRGRKPRFKNLHGPETESETEGSTGKQTPLDETMMAQRTYDLTPPPLVETHKSDDKVITKDNKHVKNAEFKESLSVLEVPKVTTPTASVKAKESKQVVINANLEEKSQTAQDTTKTLLVTEKTERSLLNPTVHSETYLIKNVSIETNTLLDILRTVQSNTAAAALEATRKSDNKTEEIPASTKSLADTQMSDTKSDDIPTTSQDRSLLSLKSLKKLDEDSNTNSPTRSDTASPYTLKKVTVSPARSDSSSPLTLIKVGQSPTRSDTSSPLTLKKVTRRYERRSRRGDDSAHKTLEETFAEIAAQSCKAVLAAKSFDINDEFIAQKTEQDKLEMGTRKFQTEQDGNEEKLQENFEKPLHKVPDLESSSADVSKTSQDIKRSSLEVSTKPETTTEMSTLETSELNVSENDLETPESSKVTPVRRGRKPKNRITEVVSPNTKDDTSFPKNKKDIDKSKDTLQAKESEQLSSSKDTSTVSPIKTNEYTIEQQELNKETSNIKDKSKITKESTKIIEISKVEENKQPDYNTESSVQLETQETHSKSPEDDSKSSKKLNKKRDANKESPITTEDNNTKQEDDIGTPKQTTKKRDSSLTKSETKSIGKKSTKKTKTNEDSSSPQKQDNTPKNTTPPPKRGRKPKNQKDLQQPTSSSKKKNKKETLESNDDENLGEKRKEVDSESESLNSSLDKSIDEKMAKKKRQKKLKEAFEAALTDDHNKSKEGITQDITSSSSFGLTLLNKSPPPPERDSFLPESIRNSCITPVEPEEDPDPLKDIEKFIADGVNLLKKDYKLDEDSVDDVLTNKTNEITETSPTNDDKPVFNTFETPADTPITTPSVTPPPKSPNSVESIIPDENSGVRRSHRIKLITQTPKALVGRGLVRDKERFSIKDDVETKSHYTLDDHLMDLAEVEAKNAKFLKEMEERLSNFQVIKENDYLCERVISREARKMICDCFLTHEEEGRGELGCGEDCLNRLLMIECGPECNVKERCTNKRFQKLLCSPCRVFRTEKKGFGIMADIEILPGEFIMEYVGEVIDTEIFEQRRIMYSQDKNRHYYFMALRSDAIIDATIKGNISRFINHSCDPNAETQKWTVNGELRIGFFSRKSIMPGEEITFNYQYQRYGREAQRCYCESSNCRGWIGPEPTSDEGEQIDDDEDESEYDDDELEEEEAQVTATLLQPDDDDDEDSDASVVDPEEVQKKLEMAAAQAEVELAPIPIMEETAKEEVSIAAETTENDDLTKPKPEEEEEDSKSKFKKLLSIMAEKVAAKQKQNKREQKLQRKKKSKESSLELANKLRFLEDPDIEDEVEFLRECGLKNQSDTLRLSRLMVRAKLVQTRLNLLDILRKGDLPCRRLFLDYHGLRLVHGWMSEDAGNMQIRMALLQTLETLPIANKTVLTDSKVMQMVRNWCGSQTALSPNDDSSSSNSNSQDASLTANANLEEGSDLQELQKLALKLITTWEGLPEIFRIPKKERIEQMKEHEREADRQYAANAEKEENKTLTDRYRRDRFGKGLSSTSWTAASTSNRFLKPNNGNPLRNSNTTTTTTPENNKNLSKAQRREMFAAKVARDEAEKRMAEERREFETKCRFFGLDPKKTRPQDVPFCVNPASGQWYSVERKPITTPPSYAHVQVPVKPKSTDPNDYQLPAACSNLPPQWKYAITPLGKIYYYHIKYRIPQWEPPTLAQLQQCEMEAEEEADSESELVTTAGEDSSEDDDEILIGMDAVQLRAYIDRKVESRRQKRYQRLVDQRPISPRREEDRIYNQIEVRKYKENKEKIRKRKEEIRRKRAEALRQTSLNMCTLGSIAETNLNALKIQTESDEELGVLPIQDYLLSSDEEIDLKVEVNSPLIDKIVEGDKIVDELDALTSKRQLKRPLPPHRDLSEPSTSTAASALAATTTIDRQEYKKRKLEKKEKRKPKDQDAKYRKNKEKFRCEIAGIIVHHLKPYRRDTCTIGRIQSNEDFNHLARKLTHFVMIKELKYCESVGQTLVVTESVKNKSREFIKKYMAKYRDVYIKPSNDPDFKDIPFTL